MNINEFWTVKLPAQESNCTISKEFWVAIYALTQYDCADDSLLEGDLYPPAMTLLPSYKL